MNRLVRAALRTTFVFTLGCGAVVESADPDAGTEDADTHTGSADPASTGAMEAQLEHAVADLELVGAAMAVLDVEEQTLWSGAAGFARREDQTEWTPERQFRIGSVTKTFTAAIIFQLAEEGLLSLEDSVDHWVPGYFDELGIQLKHLLANTSGIASYNWIGSFDISRSWEPRALLEWTVLHEPDLQFEPGTEWAYSNTNFILLGLVIEAATGQRYTEAVESRLLAPLGLRDTYVAQSGPADDRLVDCYGENSENTTATIDPSFGWAAGAMVSTPADLARWGAALYGGSVLEAQSLAAMLTPTVLPDGTRVENGLGAFIEDDGVDAIYGHTGGIGGYLTYLYYWRNDGIVLVATTNTFGTDLRELAAYGWSTPLGFEWPE